MNRLKLQRSFTYLQIPILLHQHITQKWYCDFGPERNSLLDAQQEFVEMVWNSDTETYDAESFTQDGFQPLGHKKTVHIK